MNASDLHFMRLQSDDTTSLTVFAAQEFTSGDVTVSEAWRSTRVELTADEQTTINAIISRAKTAIVAEA